MRLKRLLVILFSWSLIDLRRVYGLGTSTSTHHKSGMSSRKRKRRTKRKYKNSKYTKRNHYRVKHFKYSSSRPKAHRNLNQKSLRMMYKNLA